MAFISMMFVYLAILLAIIFFFTTIGIILLVVGFIMKRRYIKEPTGKKKFYLIPKIIGCLCMVPLVGSITFVVGAIIVTNVKQQSSLAYHVMNNDIKGTERLLKKGVSPDCTLESNSPAENGEQTLLSILCEKGFTDLTGHEKDGDPKDELAMIELLLDYGADTEVVHYFHEKDDPCHGYEDEMSVYKANDRCGSTPLLDAVYVGKTDVVEVLLEHGADVNAKDFSGYNAMNVAAEFLDDSNMDIVNLLMEYGCDPGNVTNFKQSSFFLVYRRNQDDILAEFSSFFSNYVGWDTFDW